MATGTPDEGAHRIGGNVRAARRAKGMSLDVLAGLVGRSKGWLSKIENGKARLERRGDIAALAEALQVSADHLLGGPAPEVRPDRRQVNLLPLQRMLLDAGPSDPPDVRARPIEALRDGLTGVDAALRRADHPAVARVLPDLIGELYVHAASGSERARSQALRLLILACGSDAACTLRHLGENHLAYISGERAQQAADLLGDPVWTGAAAYARAHARASANRPRPLLRTPQAADALEPYVGDDVFAHQVHGMLRLSAALARAVEGDHRGADDQAGEAARLASRIGEDSEAFELFGPANVGVWRASLAVEAARPEHALRCAEAVNPRALSSGNRRAALHMEKARALAMLDRDREAVRELCRAERLSAAQLHNHPLIRELVADMLTRTGGRELRGLAWRMNLI
ncbi:helix-turn-helix domain-containing protein [Bailinhaonella thermotolerans]|uniref:XRE family transcriptional regulator n=1 Tax=Bailinhaonella thermotolerans TaxID=1070861 RepID=A0A3A4A2P2_9ACTN|nr:helix-turn-helix transcriptional regulator [Bailinhaonella thermotolerans]RJL22600.1 XRE family transcriptional regulator [Bailinhaonella thermotolerans]